MLDVIQQFLRSYQLHEVLLEMAVIWVCVYFVFRFLKGTRGAGVIKGFALLLVGLTITIWVLGQISEAFARVNFIYERFFALLAILLIVVFQPELRQAMIRLGQARWLTGEREEMSHVVREVNEAVQFLSKNQFGALIAIERNVKLGGLAEGGQPLDARVSARLLESIFWPNNPLHDLGVILRGDRIVAAGVQFPLIEEGSLPENLGSRHRAAAGITLDSDCLVVIVSEESGAISIAEKGRIDYAIPRSQFLSALARKLDASLPEESAEEAVETAMTIEPSEGALEPTSRRMTASGAPAGSAE